MKARCNCYESIDASASEERSKARNIEHQYINRLLAFRTGIFDGAIELAARHLFKAGVYLACLGNSTADQDSDDVIRSLSVRLKEEGDSILDDFYRKNKPIIQAQANGVNSAELLRGILRRKDRTKGLLEANARNEFTQAISALERASQLSRQLESWKEGLRLEAKVSIVEIADMHERS